jgi:hypothetical protein
MLETASIAVLSLSVFMYPVREYIRELTLISILIALSSWVIRINFDLSLVNSLAHFVILILSMRYLLKIKLYRSAHIALVGMAGFLLIQLVVASLLNLLNIIVPTDVELATGRSVYLIQIICVMAVFFVSYLVSRFSLGVTKYVRPPHSFFVKEKITKKKLSTISITLIGTFTVLFGFYLCLSFELYWSVAVLLVLSTFLLYDSYRKDKPHDHIGHRPVSGKGHQEIQR